MGRVPEWSNMDLPSAGLIDPESGLLERPLFLMELDREFLRSQRSGDPFTLAFLELGGLEALLCAVPAGDAGQILATIGSILRTSIRDMDLACRCPGGLFALLLLKTSAELAHVAGERIRRAVQQRFEETLTASVGMVSFPVDAPDREGLLLRATEALERAKADQGNSVYYFVRPVGVQPEEKPRVLVVDDDRRNVRLITSYLLSQNYEVIPAYSGEEAMAIMGLPLQPPGSGAAKGDPPGRRDAESGRAVESANDDYPGSEKPAAELPEIDLVLLDVMMPGLDGYEVCRQIKSRERTRLVPVILITALDDTQAKVRGFDEAGADEFVTKPANREELLARTRALIRVRNLNRSLASVEDTLVSLATAVEAKDNYTLGHLQRVANLAVALGTRLHLSEKEIRALRMGGFLHDVGKMVIDKEILNKPGKLDEREWEIMRSHPEIGYRICTPLRSTLGPALDVVRHHHEKLDGSSYPDGLSGDQISMPARIMCVVDIYDALVTKRPYRPEAMPRDRALEILRDEVRAGKLDGRVVAELEDYVGG
jgi:putative two-component system response regulator